MRRLRTAETVAKYVRPEALRVVCPAEPEVPALRERYSMIAALTNEGESQAVVLGLANSTFLRCAACDAGNSFEVFEVELRRIGGMRSLTTPTSVPRMPLRLLRRRI
jgi:hypothetical protein